MSEDTAPAETLAVHCALRCNCDSGEGDRMITDSLTPAVERIIAARVEQARAGEGALRERAEFKVASVHHFHGDDCLCGFSSARSRSRTEHILAALRAALTEGDPT